VADQSESAVVAFVVYYILRIAIADGFPPIVVTIEQPCSSDPSKIHTANGQRLTN
jgi:hypothetical protein